MKKILISAFALITLISTSMVYGWYYYEPYPYYNPYYNHYYYHDRGGAAAAAGLGGFAAGAIVGSAISRDSDPVAREERKADREEAREMRRERRERRERLREQRKSRYYETNEDRIARLEAELKELRRRK